MASPTLVEWSPRALRDLIAIHRITALDNPRAGIAQQDYIIERTEALASYPVGEGFSLAWTACAGADSLSLLDLLPKSQ